MKFDMEQMAFCGLYCPQCSFWVACETKDLRHIQAMPEKYSRFKQMDFAELYCGGCKGENNCGPCDIKDCAQGKGLAHCARCTQFPCETLLAFAQDGVPHHAAALRNLQAIREVGEAAWFAGLEPDLQCSCGKRMSWYHRCAEHDKT